MAGRELKSFLSKFHLLWRAGESAKLDLETHAGQAWVGVRVHLGPACPHQEQEHQQKKTRNSPARERRRARRLAARQTNENENVSGAGEADTIESESVAENYAIPLTIEADAIIEQVEAAADVYDAVKGGPSSTITVIIYNS